MAKKLPIVVLFALLLAASLGVRAQSGLEGDTDTELQSVSLSVSGTRVSVSGAEGQVLEVYNLTGVKIATYRIDSDSKQLSLAGLPGGYYILKVGSVVRKISIR
ncbi:MAG: T9SS type A sorting domain-containing protein [Prevotellaceae bacterium]|nr:T9SS type A sorting domain-containing protein [Prevotellaceae bacterium]